VIHTLIISQALIQHQDGVSLHPDLFAWEGSLAAYKQTWFECADKNPLAWYAALCDQSPTRLLAEQCDALPQDASQYWVVSPYHATVARSNVRVYPEGLFPCSADDAAWLCGVLNPLLAEDGMVLCAVGSALLLACQQPMHAKPLGFGAISGQRLPGCDHEGADGGRLNRLLSEIQMLLFQHPSTSRQERGEVDVNGLWFWAPVDSCDHADATSIAVATRNPALQSIVDGQDATVMITEVERFHELVKAETPLPKCIVLAGAGHAVLLKKSIMPTFGKRQWKAKLKKRHPASKLFSMLQSTMRINH